MSVLVCLLFLARSQTSSAKFIKNLKFKLLHGILVALQRVYLLFFCYDISVLDC